MTSVEQKLSASGPIAEDHVGQQERLWLSVYVRPIASEVYPTAVLTLVGQAVAEISSQVGLRRCFFVNYRDELGPHLRLRLQTQRNSVREHEKAFQILQAATKELHAEASLADFIPEVDRYGGPMLIDKSLDYFSVSSVASVSWLKMWGQSDRAAQMRAAMELLACQAAALSRSVEELRRLLNYCADWQATYLPSYERSVRVFERQAESLAGAVGQLVEETARRTAFSDLPTDASRSLSAVVCELDRDRWFSVLGSQMHMTANRLGLRNAEEVYLTGILTFALERHLQVGSGCEVDLEERLKNQDEGLGVEEVARRCLAQLRHQE